MTILQALVGRRLTWPSSRNIVATGGNSTFDSDSYRFHVFTGPGTFTVTSAPDSATVSWYLVAGGGGGGSGGVIAPYGYCGAGGGGGGIRSGTLPIKTGPYSSPPSPTGPWSYSILVGAGGAGGIDGVPSPPAPVPSPTVPPTSFGSNGYGFDGSVSRFDIRMPPRPPSYPTVIQAYGGGGGASRYSVKYPTDYNPWFYTGRPGGCGSGALWYIDPVFPPSYMATVPGGPGNNPNVPLGPDYNIPSPGGPQGGNGGSWSPPAPIANPNVTFGSGGGGAGASAPPMNVPSGTSPSGAYYYGQGGIGRGLQVPGFTPTRGYGTVGPPTLPSSLLAQQVFFGGGGAGGVRPPWNAVPLNVEGAPGGSGGGGAAVINANPAPSGIVNTGGGGAGAGGTNSGIHGGAGAPGIVFIYYRYEK